MPKSFSLAGIGEIIALIERAIAVGINVIPVLKGAIDSIKAALAERGEAADTPALDAAFLEDQADLDAIAEEKKRTS